VARLVSFANSRGLAVSRTVFEIGSGLNRRRAETDKVAADSSVQRVVVHRDRLMHFGCEYVETMLAAQGRRLVVVDLAETKDELMPDLAEVLTSVCAPLYPPCSAGSRAKKAIGAMMP
jgi:predicted site-specific integrase-resolvase